MCCIMRSAFRRKGDVDRHVHGRGMMKPNWFPRSSAGPRIATDDVMPAFEKASSQNGVEGPGWPVCTRASGVCHRNRLDAATWGVVG